MTTLSSHQVALCQVNIPDSYSEAESIANAPSRLLRILLKGLKDARWANSAVVAQISVRRLVTSRPCGGDDFACHSFRQLHRIGADVPATAMDEHSFCRVDVAIVEEHLLCRAGHDGTDAA